MPAAINGLRGSAARDAARPFSIDMVKISSHKLRSEHRHQARKVQDSRIRHLEHYVDMLQHELQQWHEWWHGFTALKAGSGQFGNWAYAVDGVKEALAEASDVFWYPFTLLEGMASHCDVVIARAVVASASLEDSHLLVNGESLLNLMHEKKFVVSQIIASVLAHCADDSWQLEYGDIVYIGSEIKPSKVIRIGYGDYEREVRVIGLNESENVWASGRWVRTDNCHKLEIGDTVVACANITDATKQFNIIPKGAICVYDGLDSDGDINFTLIENGLSTVVFKNDLIAFTLR